MLKCVEFAGAADGSVAYKAVSGAADGSVAYKAVSGARQVSGVEAIRLELTVMDRNPSTTFCCRGCRAAATD